MPEPRRGALRKFLAAKADDDCGFAGELAAPIGGKEDHESSSKNIVISREEVDKRMISPRIKVAAGPHEVTWDGRDTGGHTVRSGLYVYELASGGQRLSRRMLVSR